jgi:hypothetical protein
MRTLSVSSALLVALALTGCSSSSLTAPAAADVDVQPDPAVTPLDPTEEAPADQTEQPADEPEAPEAPEPPEAPQDPDPPESTTTQTPPPAPEPLECGPNAFEQAGACECATDYTVCDASDESIGCCAFGTDTFAVTFVRATVLPYADAAEQDPWDWSGFVPGWVQDLVEIVAVYFVEDATDWVDLLDYVYAFAPELLEGSTPPDPAIDVEVAGDHVFSTETQDDTLEPVWNETAILTVGAGEDLVLDYHDVDWDFDDHILTVGLTRTDLQWLAGLGELTFEGSDGLYDFTIVVEPIF